ncbi:MAG: family transcriptional regulator, cyclic receptor protein [Actinomycetota bacterium]|jgi:CRP-like cAMP-binding protein|nr:family transcriptional regulator, cyclic receptor protein [Actinomycetota bacterium]
MLRSNDPKMRTLSRIEVLSGLTPRQLEGVCRLTTELRLPADRILCREGDEAREVFLLADGQVAVSRGDGLVGVVQAGGIVGEMGVLDVGRRSATAMALTDVTVHVLSTWEFSRLLEEYPTVAANVRALVAARAEENEALRAA